MTIPLDLLEQAACAGTDPEIFFPTAGEPGHRERTRAAITMCQTCPIRLACLDEALEFTESGIWGGLTAQQRDKMSDRTRRPYKYGMAS